MIEAVTHLLRVLDELGIRYYAGGSVASSIHGIARYTQDLDLVAEIREADVARLAHSLAVDFYADEGQMRSGVQMGRSFNLIHLKSGFKIDIYPMPGDEFHQSELARRAQHTWAIDPAHSVQLPVASAEDTLLSKLVWYRRGGEASDRQWSDILGIARTRKLDYSYLSRWAGKLGVASLMERISSELS